MDEARVDVLIVGSGPSGAAVAERLSAARPDLVVGVVERGPLVRRSHFYDGGGTVAERDAFVAEHRVTPWTGMLGAGGALLPMVGGRGVVGGAQLHRFSTADMVLWPDGRWPVGVDELARYFALAEASIMGRHVATGEAQRRLLDLLADYAPLHPPHAQEDAADATVAGGFPHRSSVERLLTAVEGRGVRLFARTLAARIEFDGASPARATALECLVIGDGPDVPRRIGFDTLVLAASPVESARLLLASISPGALSPAAGRYLAEHVYLRGLVALPDRSWAGSALNVFLPPPSTDLADRYQIEIRSMGATDDGTPLLRITGSAAMDPAPDNRVEVDPTARDEYGLARATTHLELSAADRTRTATMRDRIAELGRTLDGRWVSPAEMLPSGASYHESGTLRVGAIPGAARAADPDGLVDGTVNVFTGDAAAFPTVGVANPILTLTAMGYRLADTIAGRAG